MAKELPFFKFEPSQWDTGNIQMCSQEAKGIFIDICCIYWQRLGELPYKLAVQKVCGGNAVALQSLCDEGVIKVIEDMICIDFLNEQLLGFENTSAINSKNARDGWETRRKNAVALRSQSDGNAIREDKSKGKEIKENKSKVDKELLLRNRAQEFGETLKNFVGEYPKEMVRAFYDYWSEPNHSKTKMRFETEKTWDVSRRLATWASRDKGFQKHPEAKANTAEAMLEQLARVRAARGADVNGNPIET